MILSTLLTGKYYTAHLVPLMSHKFWTITTLTPLQHGRSDRWGTAKFSSYGPDKAILFWKIKIAKMILYLNWKWKVKSVDIKQ